MMNKLIIIVLSVFLFSCAALRTKHTEVKLLGKYESLKDDGYHFQFLENDSVIVFYKDDSYLNNDTIMMYGHHKYKNERNYNFELEFNKMYIDGNFLDKDYIDKFKINNKRHIKIKNVKDDSFKSRFFYYNTKVKGKYIKYVKVSDK